MKRKLDIEFFPSKKQKILKKRDREEETVLDNVISIFKKIKINEPQKENQYRRDILVYT